MALSTGLISYWRMEDLSGNLVSAVGGNTLIASGLTYQVTGKVLKCIGLDGSTSQANVPFASQTDLDIPLTSDRTYSFWFKTTFTSGSLSAFIIDKRTATGVVPANIISFSVFLGKLRASLFANGVTTPGGALQGSTTVNDGVFHLGIITFTRSATGLRMYVDNVEQVASPKNTTGLIAIQPTVPFYIGRSGATPGGTGFYPGNIDEVACWNRVLSAQEISDVWNGGNGVILTPTPDPTPSPLPGVSASIPSTSIKQVVNSARFKGSTVLDTTNEVGKDRLSDISTFRDTILSVMKATSKADVHVNTSAGKKLKAIASLDPLTATAVDIINAAKNA